ncbi:hypothetical protein [Vibrio phage vB_VibM_10AMN]|uniref:Uncharacterized protein n=1 Tax=Staphylococcus phage vB_VibM_10AMN12 TaxID=3076785 RepID=A0AA96R6M8_9CAUD|nr:hypothetical protein [Vibrio phage vB_VibM_10AMN]WNO47502.1 hypothetical protein [Staphylococcus phage vB_VibM_10AMN12]
MIRQHKKLWKESNVSKTEPLAGGGKSWSLLADALKYIDCPDFYAVFFRKTIKQLRRTLWKEAKKMYMPLLMNKNGKFIGKAVIKEQDMIIRFPSGATIEFSYLDRDQSAEENWQGEIFCAL